MGATFVIPLLSRGHHEVLAQLAWARVLIAFDFDGTLAPIVSRPAAARMRGRTTALLQRVSRLYPCAVISGRGQADIEQRLAGADVRYVVGNRGLEPDRHGASLEAEIALARSRLEPALARLAGVELEDKRYALALHYRRSRNKRQTSLALASLIAGSCPDMRVIAGKLLFHVLPRAAPSKGDALVALRAAAGADTALYVGDDVTDEDVFTLDQPGRLVSIRVGRSPSSAAAYFLRDQAEIDLLLAALAALRKEDHAGARPA
jgi:trehalose 6-phosphate phosphatase